MKNRNQFLPDFKPSIIAALLLMPLSAAAQEAAESSADGSATELGSIEVVSKNRSTRTENKNSYTTSAMRTTTGLALSPRETPQSVSVITKTQLSEQGISNLAEALKTTTGVNVTRDGGRWRLESRGFQMNKIEEDGVSTTIAAGNNGNPYRDAQGMSDLAIYDHIEVVRGATGLTQGQGTPGGTVNAVRKKPTSRRQIQGEVSVDRWGGVRGVADVSGSLNSAQTLRGRLVGVLENDRSFKDRVDAQTYMLYGVMDAQIGERGMLTWGALYQHTNEVPDLTGLPMGLNNSDSGLPRDTYLGLDWNKQRQTKINLFTEYEHDFNDDWRLSGKINYTRNRLDYRYSALNNSATSYPGLVRGGTLPLNNLNRYNNSGYQLGFQLNLNGTYRLFNREHDLFAGYGYSYESNDSHRRQFANSTAYDPFTFRGNEVSQPDWNSAPPYLFDLNYGSKISSHGLMLGTRFNPTDSLHLLLGTRWTSWKSRGVTDYSWWNGRIDNDPTSYSTIQRNRFVPYAGLTWDVNANHSLYASYTSIFDPNSSRDRNGNFLDPVVGNNYEIGWKTSWRDGRLNTALSLFQIDQKNRSISVLDPVTGRSYNEPVGHVRSRGLDAEISGNLTDDWKLFAGYTFNRSKFMRGADTGSFTTGRNFSEHTPAHMFRLYTSYRLPGSANKWTIGGGLSAQSKTNSLWHVRQGGYALFNANVQYEINEHMKLSLIGSNLTDRRVYENNRVRTSGINNFYIEPRNIMLKFNWQM